MKSLILVAYKFDGNWPFTADAMHKIWKEEGETIFIRFTKDEKRSLLEIVGDDAKDIFRLVSFNVLITVEDLIHFPVLEELGIHEKTNASQIKEGAGHLYVYTQPSEGFWAESVSEFGIALTLCGLRRIPQLHQAIQTSLKPWNYSQDPENILPNQRGAQYGDDPMFTSGTVSGKKIRILGAGNIASRYAQCMTLLGAEVKVYDPFANEPCFTLAGAKKVWHLDELMKDADIFVPMVPLMEATQGMVTENMIDSLPKGCLVVMVTRAGICHMPSIRRRVLNDEISLAADVFDKEPLPLDDPLLGRHNVVHTPHNAGRTEYSNQRVAEKLAEQFRKTSNTSISKQLALTN
ncbi:MAG: hydroxyacid dehydrogenase [Planctomycetota bacterium]|nr:MAG: hydroxyacid dehydrogenase [Planctomycetota bacterium]